MSFASEMLTIERDGAVGTLWLDRPEKRNAMSRALWGAIPGAIEELSSDLEVRVIIVAARGKSFCVGLDLEDMGSDNAADSSGASGKPSSRAVANLRQIEVTRKFQAAISSVAKCPVPVIAAIHSHCIGGGIDLATACDIRLASADAIFSVRETRIGIVADVGTLQRLPGIITAGHVAELAYTGRDFDASRAEEIGFVNAVHPDSDAVYQAALDLANEIAANPPLAVRGTKFILQQSEDLTTEQSLLLNALWTMATTLPSNDLREAVKAFAQKREPNFDGS